MKLRRIRIHPVKSLTGVDVLTAGFTGLGALQGDRQWCLVRHEADQTSPETVYMTKVDKSAASSAIARTRTKHSMSSGRMSLEIDGMQSADFALPDDDKAMAAWCSEQYDIDLRLKESGGLGWSDAAVFLSEAECVDVSGPTVVSTATLAYLGDRMSLPPDELLLRFRTNLLIHVDGLEPFGEELLPDITLGDVRLVVTSRVQRCPVPARHPATGEFDASFARRFVEAKLATTVGKSLDRSDLYTCSVYTRVLTLDAELSVTPESETQAVIWDKVELPRILCGSSFAMYEIFDVQPESAVISSFYLRPVNDTQLPHYLPGQFLPIRLTIPGQPEPIIRTYTVSDRSGQGYIRLSIKREGNGLVSRFFHDEARPGTTLEALPPRGKFHLDETSDRPVVLVSAGVGITPMIAMANHLASNDQSTEPRRTYFVHGATNGRTHAFADHTRKLAATHESFSNIICYSRPCEGDVLGETFDFEGNVSIDTLKELLPLDDYDFYLCGPPAFMQSMFDGLIGVGVASDRIHHEEFGPAAVVPPSSTRFGDGEAAAADPIKVRFASSDVRVEWTPDKGTLLELAESVGINAAFSCRSGVCGVCAARVVSGTVDYVEEPIAPLTADTVLVCCSWPRAKTTTAAGAEADDLILEI